MDTGQGERNAAVENEKSHTHELYTDLLTLMREMFIHYRQLLQLAERESLTAASLPTLIEITMQKETILLELSILEEGRQLLLRKLGEQLGVQPSALTLGKLSELASEPLTSAFENFHKDLLPLVRAAEQVNTQNTILLTSSLDSTRTSSKIVSRVLKPVPSI